MFAAWGLERKTTARPMSSGVPPLRVGMKPWRFSGALPRAGGFCPNACTVSI